MDVENAKLVDGLIFGYLGRRQYQETLRAFCNEAPSLRDNRHRFENGGDVYIQVSDQLHEKNLEQIVNAFAVVGRFDVSPELIDFGIRLRDLTNEFSTMTAVKGRTVSKQPPSRASQPSLRDTEQQKSQQFLTTYCASQSGNQAAYQNANVHSNQPQQVLSQQDYNYDYQPQPHASTYMMPNSSSYSPMQIVSQTSIASSAQDIPATNTITYLTTGPTMPTAHPPTSCEQPMLIDYGVNVKDNQQDMNTTTCTRNDASEQCGNAPHAHLSSSFSSESGAHKRKAAVPHRRDELVAQTAQSLIVPNGVLLDLDSDAVANSASHASLLSNIDDSAMQCLDRLINGNLNEVFPFCDDHGELSGFDAEMENPYPRNQSRGSVCPEEGTGDPFSEPAPPPLDVGPSHSPPPEAHASKSRSLDEGEIVSEENLHGKTEKPASGNKVVVRSDDFETTPAREHSPTPRSESRRSSLDSGRSKRDERRTADRLKDFNRNPPKSHSNPRKSTDRSELKDAMIFESGNVPRVHTPTSTGSRLSRERTRGFSSLFEEGHSNPSSRDSSPHREKLSRKEEERRRREKEMEKERQRDKERLKRQRRDRHRESDRQPQHSPDRKVEKKARQRDDEEKNRDTKEKEKKREQAEERRVIDEADRRKAEEKSRREMVKKKKEEELEARRQAELQRRAEAMRRKEEEERRRRQEEKERQEEKRREEEKRCLEEEKKKKREEDLARREEEKSQKRRDEGDVVQEELRKDSEEGRREANSDASDGQETARSTVHSDQESCSSDGDNAPSADNMRSAGRDEETMPSRKESRGQEQKPRSLKTETRKGSETINRHAERDVPLESEDDGAPPSETDERRKKSREEVRPSKSTTDNKKPPPLPIPIRRREEQKRTSVKPLEPGMMMSDPGVLDRINKEMESLTPSSKNRPSSNRSPEESLPSVKSLPTTRIPKRDTPVDYNQVLFSNPPVVKRTPPVVEKKKNYVISSGLSTPNVNQMVFSKAHSSRLGMFLEKVSDKHKRLMERENDRATASPAYDDPDRNGAPSPIGFSHFPRQQQQKFVPQKRPLPATSLDSYLGSPPQGSPDIRDGESTSSRSTGKKCKLDLSKMPDIIDKLYGGK
uniref:LisH domain-containing protein n=1 Tax=Haemonchus contortus TaxID=6289 RepID=A0A7I4YW53_HAECO